MAVGGDHVIAIQAGPGQDTAQLFVRLGNGIGGHGHSEDRAFVPGIADPQVQAVHQSRRHGLVRPIGQQVAVQHGAGRGTAILQLNHPTGLRRLDRRAIYAAQGLSSCINSQP